MPLLLSARRSTCLRLLVVLTVAITALSSGTMRPARAATASGGSLSGVVRDQDGIVQDQAEVVLADASGVTVASVRTESSGRYSLSAAVGTYQVDVVTVGSPTPMVARVQGVEVGLNTTLDVVVLTRYRNASSRMAAASVAATGPLQQASQPPATVTWTGIVRHNGVPVQATGIWLDGASMIGSEDTDDQGHFELHIPPGHYPLDFYAYVGTTFADDSSGAPPGVHITVPDVDLTTDRNMDIDIPTTSLMVHVVDAAGHPTTAGVGGTSGGDGSQGGADVEIFPGGHGRGWLSDYATTDANGTAELLMFAGSPPPQIYASSDYGVGSATVPLTAHEATVALVANSILSGTVRDARGPLPSVNDPWISFGGPGWGSYHPFSGSHVGSDGRYELSIQQTPKAQLTLTDEPDYEEDDTAGYQPTATLPKVWTIKTDIDMTASRTLDLTIPDARPVDFRAVDTDGRPLTVSYFDIGTTHTIDLAPGLTGTATAESDGAAPDGRFQHMLFGPAETTGYFNAADGSGSGAFYNLPLSPGHTVALAYASSYSGGHVTIPAPTTTTSTSPVGTGSDPDATSQKAEDTGYWALGSDGHVYNFGDAPALGNAAAGSVDLEPTPSGKGYWVLSRDGAVQAFGDATKLGNVDTSKLAKSEQPASLSATPSGQGYWVFTNRGRVLTFGDAPFLGDMSGKSLNGAVLGSVATPTGKGYYMVASDGGIFAFGDATFAGSMGGKKLNAPVQSVVPDGDGHGYWLVASDGGIFAFDAPFRGSMGGTKLNKPLVGMVRYGDGYLMVAADGGIFNFSTAPFAGSLGDQPPASPVVAVAALP